MVVLCTWKELECARMQVFTYLTSTCSKYLYFALKLSFVIHNSTAFVSHSVVIFIDRNENLFVAI